MQIAIDGPAAAGKTSLGRALAEHFGCLFVETGKMYRAVALGLARGIPLAEMEITLNRDGRLFLNGEDVTDLLHTPEMDQASSRVATYPEVRERLVELQRSIAAGNDVVMEGRDIGTVVLPDADVKIFLEASPETRARRRVQERPGLDYDETLREIIARDRRDSTRELSPLNPAPDAIIITTDQKSLTEVISEAIGLVRERLRKGDASAAGRG
ncbi:(d)CMP kinase [Candidatus Bipolaricaulota bacterium]|jgi:cytidylate kinase|nr:(d)CMP kinase [Candidatus Bipolaricaulota bacterium]